MGVGHQGLKLSGHTNGQLIPENSFEIIKNDNRKTQRRVSSIIDYIPQDMLNNLPEEFCENEECSGNNDFKFYEYSKKQLSRELRVQVDDVFKSIKDNGLDLSVEQSEILKKGLFGYDVLDGQHSVLTSDYVKSIITTYDIELAIKSYYRKKALQAFERFTKALGIKSVLRSSYDVNEDAEAIYDEINGDYYLLKSANTEKVNKIQKKYENAMDTLTEEEKEYIYIANHDVLIGYTFDTCFSHIKQMSDKLFHTFIKLANEEKKDFFKKKTAGLLVSVLNSEIDN